MMSAAVAMIGDSLVATAPAAPAAAAGRLSVSCVRTWRRVCVVCAHTLGGVELLLLLRWMHTLSVYDFCIQTGGRGQGHTACDGGDVLTVCFWSRVARVLRFLGRRFVDTQDKGYVYKGVFRRAQGVCVFCVCVFFC